MEQEILRGQPQKYDVLVLDAFSSDAIPVHLLTKEAMEIYLKHLRDQDSVVAFHISNRILDLVPVLKGLSREFKLSLIIVQTGKGPVSSSSTWGFLSRNSRALETVKRKSLWNPSNKKGDHTVLWTDNYSNIFRLISSKALW